jgi:signal peptidase I
LLFAAGCNRRTFMVPTSSMKPTIQRGDKVTADMWAYFGRSPKRWDIVMFHPVDERYKDAIWAMRVVGLPNERVTFAPDGGILIDDKMLQQPTAIASVRYSLPSDGPFSVGPTPLAHPFSIPADSYYVLGDYVRGANDSRFWGVLPRKNIIGKVLRN